MVCIHTYMYMVCIHSLAREFVVCMPMHIYLGPQIRTQMTHSTNMYIVIVFGTPTLHANAVQFHTYIMRICEADTRTHTHTHTHVPNMVGTAASQMLDSKNE